MQPNFLLPGVGMIAQLKEDKLEADIKLISIPPPTVSRKLGETMDGNISDKQHVAIKEPKSNSTHTKELNSEIPKMVTPIIKEINAKGTRGRCDPS